MSGDLQRDLVVYRMEQAHKALGEATLLRSAGQLLGTVNRAYYAMFYCVQALLAKAGLKSSKHIGAISFFDREYVKSELFDRIFSRWLHDLFELRQESDYSDLCDVTAEQAQEALDHARAFVEKTMDFLKTADNRTA